MEKDLHRQAQTFSSKMNEDENEAVGAGISVNNNFDSSSSVQFRSSVLIILNLLRYLFVPYLGTEYK